MTNLKIYETIKPYIGTDVTLTINAGRQFEKKGILMVNEGHSHIFVIGKEPCALIPLSEEANILSNIKNRNDVIIYQNISKQKIMKKK